MNWQRNSGRSRTERTTDRQEVSSLTFHNRPFDTQAVIRNAISTTIYLWQKGIWLLTQPRSGARARPSISPPSGAFIVKWQKAAATTAVLSRPVIAAAFLFYRRKPFSPFFVTFPLSRRSLSRRSPPHVFHAYGTGADRPQPIRCSQNRGNRSPVPFSPGTSSSRSWNRPVSDTSLLWPSSIPVCT